MADVTQNFKVNVAVDDAKWQAFVKSVNELTLSFGKASKSVIEGAQKIATSAEQAATKQVAAAKQVQTNVISAQTAIQAATERRVKAEESAESMKFEHLKEESKKQQKLIDDLNNAKKEASTKEAKAEVQIEINKAKELQQVYKKELAERPESKKEKGGGAMHNIVAGAEHGLGFGAAIEGLKLIKEKSEEAARAEQGLAAGTGLTGKALEEQSEAAEKLGQKYAVSGEIAKGVEGHISAATGQTGKELDKTTEAVIAYASAHRKAGQSVEEALGKAQKKMDTAKGAAEVMAEASLNMAKAQAAANTPAAQMEKIQNTLTETIGKVALTVLNALGPALTAITPIIASLGDLVGSILKPALEALTPVMTLVGQTFGKLAPILVDLINTGLQMVIPMITDMSDIFAALVPPLLDVVKVIIDSLNPVFKALMPIINQLAGIIKEILVQNAGVLIDILQNILVPVIRDLVAPILLSLMPLIQALADLLMTTLVPIAKLLSSVLKFLMENIIQPLIKWLSGGLVTAITAVVGVITKAVETVKSITSALGSLLGLGGDEAKAATKANGQKVLAQEQENNELAKAQQEKALRDREKLDEAHLVARLKAGKLSADEEAELREKAQDENDEKLLAQLDKFDQKKAKQGASAAAKEKKSFIEQQQALIDLGEQGYDEAIKNLEKYYERLKETDIKGRKDVSNAIEKFKTAEFEEQKKDEDISLKQQELALLKQGLNDEDFAEQKEALEIQHTQNLLKIAEKNGQDTLDLQLQLINQQISQQKRLDKEMEDSRKTDEANNQAHLDTLNKQSEKDRLINEKLQKERIDSQMKEAEFFAGPLVQGFTNGFHKLMKGADDWTQSMMNSNNIIVSIFGGILDGFVKMIEGMIEKIIAIEAILLVADLIPGFGGLMDAIGGISSLIPHADGGIMNHAEGGVGVNPVTLGRHRFFEAGAEAIIPLSSGRAQNMMQTAFGFDKALSPVVNELQGIKTHVAKPMTVLPLNNAFENARNNYLKSEDRRSI